MILFWPPLHVNAMDKRTFQNELARLQKLTRSNQDCFQSEGCENCTSCQFTNHCKDCHRCTYAERSVGCTHCTHIRGCRDSHQSSQLIDCARCIESHYLVLSQDCSSCTYCFGCVGLVRKEFHILNEPYDRKTYFKLVKALMAELAV